MSEVNRPELDPGDIFKQFTRGESMDAIAQRYEIRRVEVENLIRFAIKLRTQNYV